MRYVLLLQKLSDPIKLHCNIWGKNISPHNVLPSVITLITLENTSYLFSISVCYNIFLSIKAGKYLAFKIWLKFQQLDFSRKPKSTLIYSIHHSQSESQKFSIIFRPYFIRGKKSPQLTLMGKLACCIHECTQTYWKTRKIHESCFMEVLDRRPM